jgi:hypothetical protein
MYPALRVYRLQVYMVNSLSNTYAAMCKGVYSIKRTVSVSFTAGMNHIVRDRQTFSIRAEWWNG